MDRRSFLHVSAGSVLSASTLAGLTDLTRAPKYRAVAFDAFPIFDPRPVGALAERLFPGKGAELTNAWRTRQFEYQWLRATGHRYADFRQTTEDALVFASRSLKLELTADARSQLVQAYFTLDAWPDVRASLDVLKRQGVKVALLSNMTAAMLNANIEHAGLGGMFDHVLSTDRIRTYKPDPRAYQLGVDAFKLPRESIVFCAFAGWDAAGAKWFGYPTVWINRADAPAEELSATPDATGRSLTALTDFVGVHG
jgi:2-haloacid dehalogenase